jgi:hypothetical protein
MRRFALVLSFMLLAGCAHVFGRPNAHLLEDGAQAPATVKSIEQTGQFINDNPVCKITLNVTPKGSAPFVTSVEQVVLLTQLPQLQPGAVLTVRYDERDHAKAIIQAFGALPTLSEDEARQVAVAASALRTELNAPGAAVEATGVVMRFDETGVFVNGPNPLAVVTVKVLPSGGAPYEATIRGVFASSSLPKYQPGREVHLRVDPKDPSRVTFDTARMQVVLQP